MKDDLITTATSGDEAARGASVALLPVGSFEQHGDHLPLITDTVVACAIAAEIAKSYPVLRLPPLTISCSHEHAGWAGTVSISAKTLYTVVQDIAASLEVSDVRKLVLVNLVALRSARHRRAGRCWPVSVPHSPITSPPLATPPASGVGGSLFRCEQKGSDGVPGSGLWAARLHGGGLAQRSAGWGVARGTGCCRDLWWRQRCHGGCGRRRAFARWARCGSATRRHQGGGLAGSVGDAGDEHGRGAERDHRVERGCGDRGGRFVGHVERARVGEAAGWRTRDFS